MADSRTFTEKEHEALVADAVRREVASAVEVKDAKVLELEAKIDTLEAEKASAEQAAEEAATALTEFKADQERQTEVASRKDERIASVKRISARELPEAYFTDERVTRWAEMADEAFAELLEDIAAPSIAALVPEEASQLEGTEGEARLDKLAEILTARREAAAKSGDVVIKETAAFSGGATPTTDEKGKPSSMGAFFQSIA